MGVEWEGVISVGSREVRRLGSRMVRGQGVGEVNVEVGVGKGELGVGVTGVRWWSAVSMLELICKLLG